MVSIETPRIGWQDFPAGREIETPGTTVTEAHMVGWAGVTGDLYAVHMDEEFASQSRFGGRISHGPLTFALAVGQLVQSGVYGHGVIAWLGLDGLKATAPVRPGDTIRTTAVVSKSREASEGRGVVSLTCTVSNQNRETVMTFEHVLLMQSNVAVE